MASVEILRGIPKHTAKAENALTAMEAAILKAGDTVRRTTRYEGNSDWLLVFGVGAQPHHVARTKQNAKGGCTVQPHTLMLDLGYMRREEERYFRLSIDHDHPQQWFDRTPNDPSRFLSLAIELGNHANPTGKVILVGLGKKSRVYLNLKDWEQKEYNRLARKYPGRQIIYRPKGFDRVMLPCKRDQHTPFNDLVKGAAMVSARHSNCCIDAIIAGIPFHCEDGAAQWMQDTKSSREEFLYRLAHWQYKGDEADQAWAFAKGIVA